MLEAYIICHRSTVLFKLFPPPLGASSTRPKYCSDSRHLLFWRARWQISWFSLFPKAPTWLLCIGKQPPAHYLLLTSLLWFVWLLCNAIHRNEKTCVLNMQIFYVHTEGCSVFLKIINMSVLNFSGSWLLSNPASSRVGDRGFGYAFALTLCCFMVTVSFVELLHLLLTKISTYGEGISICILTYTLWECYRDHEKRMKMW